MKGTCASGGNSDQSTALESDRSSTESASCVSPIAAPGGRSAQPRISNAVCAKQAHSA